MRIHALQCGAVRLHPSQQIGHGTGKIRLVNSLLDRRWTEPQPILAWAIEHPEGLIVVDTGDTADINRPGYFPWWHPFYKIGIKLIVDRADEIDRRLVDAGLSTADVRWVVLTHLHSDHVGGLKHFPNAEIIVSRREYVDATSFSGKMMGYLAQHWPSWFQPRLIDFDDIGTSPSPFQGEGRGEVSGDAPFPGAFPLTAARDVWIAPTPGHTPGHMSVIVQDGLQNYFLAGDASYTTDAMMNLQVSGVSMEAKLEWSTLSAVRNFVKSTPTLYLPSHDPLSVFRLNAASPLLRGE